MNGTSVISETVAGSMSTSITNAMGSIVATIAQLAGPIVMVAGTFIVIGIIVSVLKLRR